MPQRFIPYAFDFIISAFTLTIFLSSMSVLTLIVGILSGLFWLSRIKGLIEKHHDGDTWSWFCWLIKKKINSLEKYGSTVISNTIKFLQNK